MSKPVSVIYSATSDVVWTRSISELRSIAYRAKVDVDIHKGMTRDNLANALHGRIDVVFVPNTDDNKRTKTAVATRARKRDEAHKVAVARAREAKCGHRNCVKGSPCRWA
jgi:hypothetical protein